MIPTTTVMIVEDSCVVYDRLHAELSRIPTVEVLTQVASVKDVIPTMGTRNPDITILDLQLPDGNGFDVLDIVKRERPKATTIVLTNFAFPQHRKRSQEQGADFFLDKSNEFNTVFDIVRWIAKNRCSLN